MTTDINTQPTALHPSRETVQTLQRLLRDLSMVDETIPRVIPDGVFTADTQEAVTAFQRREGLMPTGTADHETWRRLVPAGKDARRQLNPPEPLYLLLPRNVSLGRGSENHNLPVMQAMLKTLSAYWDDMPSLEVTGILDESTYQAVCYFQDRCGVPVTGVINTQFWNLLSRAYRLTVGTGET